MFPTKISKCLGTKSVKTVPLFLTMSPYVEGKNAEKHFPERQRVKRFNTLPASRSSKGTLSLQYSLSYNRIGTEVASFEEGIFLTKTRI